MKFEDLRSRSVPAGEEHDALTGRVIAAAIEVHRLVGPGMTEDMYEEALAHEFDLLGIRYQRQVRVVVQYKGKEIGFTRLDFLVEDDLIVELKACEALNPIHRAQRICYLRATGKRVALLINFNVPVLKDGIKRVVLSPSSASS
jgi:GxxExxY protein